MISKGFLADNNESFQKTDKISYTKLLKSDDLVKLKSIKSLYGSMDSNALMKHTYGNYPYWAINSVKAKSILNKQELDAVQKQRMANDNTILFTIGPK